jgi:hypothetical protein
VGLGLMLVAPVVNVLPANASADAPPVPAAGSVNGARSGASASYSGYYENLVGASTLTSTLTVPTVKCSNHSTWGTQVGILGLMDSSSGQVEHGGGVEVGCSSLTGTPTYTGALCDPTFTSGCGALTDPVAPGDLVHVAVAASGGCNPTCSSLSVTVTDSTASWTESWSGSSQSDFDAFMVVVGFPPVPSFSKVLVTNLSFNGDAFGQERFNLVDHGGKTLARASALSKAKSSFNVKWVASS